jgi:hypothetical protein
LFSQDGKTHSTISTSQFVRVCEAAKQIEHLPSTCQFLCWSNRYPAWLTKVSGLATDNVGASIPGVTVTFKAKNIAKKIVTASDGR